MVYANSFNGHNDSEIINNAILSRDSDGIVIIGPREKEIDSDRHFWLLDSAILLPANTTIILQNCTLKLSDACRDNFFRTANCGFGFEECEELSNIHIIGVGLCILEGADNPRATGDGSKILANPCPHSRADILKYADWISDEQRESGSISFMDMHSHSFGTDAGKAEESQVGDWRGIGILFANTRDFSIEGVRISKSHGWGISLEACRFGRVEKIDFDACMSKEINGILSNMENQDGVDIRNGCHDIIISDITGSTGDDLIALTAVRIENEDYIPGGSLGSTHVMHNDFSRRDPDIHDIIIRNVKGYSYLCYLIRLLPANTRIYNVTIDGVIDTSPSGVCPMGCMIFGHFGTYGKDLEDGLRGVSVSNVISARPNVIMVRGHLCDSVISNVISKRADGNIILLQRENALKNVVTAALSFGGEEIKADY